jgi:hypothetical protein
MFFKYITFLKIIIFYGNAGIVTGYILDGRGLIPGRCKIFLFSTASRPDLGPTQPPIQWEPRALSRGVKRQGCEATTHHHQVPRSRMVELYIHSLMSSWHSV